MVGSKRTDDHERREARDAASENKRDRGAPWNREKTEMALEEENKSGSDGKKREKEREEEREFAKRGKVV